MRTDSYLTKLDSSLTSYLNTPCPTCPSGVGQECFGFGCAPGLPHIERWEAEKALEKRAIDAAVDVMGID
jgi:hypothetical protein